MSQKYNLPVVAAPTSPHWNSSDRRLGWIRRHAHLTLRAAIVVGFALVVTLWIATAVYLAFRVHEVDRQLAVMTERFITVEDALETVRSSVLLAAIDWRDAFLDTGGPGRTDFYRRQLYEYQRQCASRFAALRSGGAIGVKTASIDVLEREVNDYWASVIPLISMAPLRQASEARRLLNERVLPKRSAVVRIVEQVKLLNRARFQQQQRAAAQLYAQAQQRVVATASFATLLSLVVGTLVIVHVTRLDRQLRAELAANAANTVDLHRLSTQLVRAQEDERRLIARELHDEVGQALTAVKMQLSVARRRMPTPEHERALDEARSVVDAALQSARNLSRLLHPPMLDDMGLVPAIEWYLRGFSERTGISADLEHEGMDERASAEVETCLFRVVQEATTNAARHADPSHCHVYLQRLPSSIVLTVEDDGRGFDPASQRLQASSGLGLLGIQERISGFRGVFRLDSAPGKGTRLTVELPVTSPLDGAGLCAPGEEREVADGANPAGR
jgi:signal transduction histidine kinase